MNTSDIEMIHLVGWWDSFVAEDTLRGLGELSKVNFHPLEVVDRGSETQRQVSKNWNFSCFFSFGELNMLNFHPLEVVDQGSKIQLQAGWNLN